LERNAKTITGQVTLLEFIGDRVVCLAFLWYSAKGLFRRNVLGWSKEIDMQKLDTY